MSFLWPKMLFLLLVVPILVTWYVLFSRRRKKHAFRFTEMLLVKEAMGSRHDVRRHIPPLLMLLALTMLITALARPTATLTLPFHYQTILLAIDVSASMQASDVAPTRIAAAQEAARAFVRKQPHNIRVGVVAYAAHAAVVQPPTQDREQVLAAIDGLRLQPGTAIGSGILVSLKTIFPEMEFNLAASDPRPKTNNSTNGSSLDKVGKAQAQNAVPVAPGSYSSAAIILLTDGQNSAGPSPLIAAMMAAEHGVRVFTLGIGTPEGTVYTPDGWLIPVVLDEDTLIEIARRTKAQYFYADNATALARIYEQLNSRFALETAEVEIAALFAAAAAAISVLSAMLSILWFHRVP